MSGEDRDIYKERIIWRETIREPRLIGFDARIVVFFLLLAAHLAWWTFGLLCAAAVIFLLVEKAGYRFPSAFRAVHSTFAGNQRPAFHKGHYRKAVDFGFEYRREWPSSGWAEEHQVQASAVSIPYMATIAPSSDDVIAEPKQT